MDEKRASRIALAAVIAAALASGCEQLQMSRPNACPQKLEGTYSFESSIQWVGRDDKKVEWSADILSVLVECIPAYHPAIETDQGRRAAFTDYELAVTAVVGYKIANQTSFETRDDANLIFEAVAASGVVLGSTKAAFRIVSGGTSGTASAKIAAVSAEEIRRVTSVQARWAYGR